jgi:hypothetical protein
MSTALKKERKPERPPRGGLATMVEAIRQGIWEEMERDPTVFVIGEDVGAYGGAFKVTEGLIEHFGKERVIDTPISEAAIVGAACGAGLMGMKPVAEFQFIDFISCGFDLLTNYAAKCRYRWGANIPAVFRGPCGSGARDHFIRSTRIVLSNTAGLKIVEPSTASRRIDQGGDSRSIRCCARAQETLSPPRLRRASGTITLSRLAKHVRPAKAGAFYHHVRRDGLIASIRRRAGGGEGWTLM